MTKYLEATGKTVDAAIESALATLGLDRDDVSVEILERPKSGFLGIGATPARVRVSYEGPDEEPEVTEAPAPAVAEEKKEGKERAPRPAPQPVLEPEPTQPVDDEVSQAITTFLSGLLAHMKVEADMEVTLSQRGSYEVLLNGDDLGQLIGRRGDTLDAIQQLTGYAVNRTLPQRVRIHVDAEGYRARREEALANLARRNAEKAIRLRKNVTLEPMNAYERHVIHTALQDYPHISTHSTGAEPNRRTVICYEETGEEQE